MILYKGDLKPDLSITCYDGSTVVNLTTATSVKVVGVRDGVALLSRTVTPAAPATGVVTMEWQAADTNTVGSIMVEVEVTWPGSKPQTFRPSTVVNVIPDLG